MAHRDTYDGVGRLILKEVQVELGAITPDELKETWQTYNQKDTIEATQEGKVFLIYWGGKEETRENRNRKTPIIPIEKPQLFQHLEYHKSESLEKADFTADKECDGIGEALEEEGEFSEVE